MAQLRRKEAEQLIKEILTEYARKIRSAKKREYAEDIQQQLFNPKIDAFYKLAKSEDMDFCIFNRLNDEGIRQLLVGCRRLAKCYELDSYGKIKDFTYEPETSKCRIASDSGGKYTAGGSYTFTLEGKAELGNKWYEPYRVVWHFYRENPGTGKYEETSSKMDEARALVDFDTWDRNFLVSEKGKYKVTATIFNQAITTGIRPDIVEVCELYFEAEERNIAALSCSDKIRIAMEYSNVIDEIREEIGDINILVTQMVIVSSFLIGLALTGYGAVAEALGFVLLAAGAAMSGTQLLAGVIELVKFFTTVDDAKTEDDLKVCGKIFGDAVAKIGVDGLFFFLSMFGLKKASARLTTRTVIDNGLNSKKWAGKQIEERKLNVELENNEAVLKESLIENKTGTVWDNITATQENYPNLKLPKSFEIKIGDKKLWVHANATEHMYENLSSNAKRLSSKNISNYQELLSINCQELLSEFYYSLEIAIKNNGLKTGEMIHGGNWEFMLSEPRIEGKSLVIKHARYNPK